MLNKYVYLMWYFKDNEDILLMPCIYLQEAQPPNIAESSYSVPNLLPLGSYFFS